MRDIDIDNAIENADCEKKEQLRAQLHTRIGLPQQEERHTKSKRRVFSLKTVSLGLAAMCVVCLAIVLPISLREDTEPEPLQKKYTYSSVDLCDAALGLTIKEYSEKIGKNILYIDWYDIAEECVTTKYFLPENENEIIYITEDLLNGETGDYVCIYVVEANISVDVLDALRDFCTLNYEYNSISIHWMCNAEESRAFFEYSGYKYYVSLDYPMSEEAILDIVKEMF